VTCKQASKIPLDAPVGTATALMAVVATLAMLAPLARPGVAILAVLPSFPVWAPRALHACCLGLVVRAELVRHHVLLALLWLFAVLFNLLFAVWPQTLHTARTHQHRDRRAQGRAKPATLPSGAAGARAPFFAPSGPCPQHRAQASYRP
jgi:hypothetical protein